jgi:hypothetical protein
VNPRGSVGRRPDRRSARVKIEDAIRRRFSLAIRTFQIGAETVSSKYDGVGIPKDLFGVKTEGGNPPHHHVAIPLLISLEARVVAVTVHLKDNSGADTVEVCSVVAERLLLMPYKSAPTIQGL